MALVEDGALLGSRQLDMGNSGQHKTRHGAKVHKVYDTAKTPYQRLLERGVLTHEQRDALERQYHRLNPVQLLAQINQALECLWSLADHPDHEQASVALLPGATTVVR